MDLRACIVLAALLAPTAAAAATDQAKFGKLLGKTTLGVNTVFTDFQKAKVACVCREPGPLNDGAGILLREFIGGISNFRWFVVCVVPSFDGTGNLNAIEGCGDNWELLTK